MKDLNISIVIALVKKNFTLKYKQTLLGFLWSLLHPAFFLLIFIAVFSSIFKTVENYPLYVLSGLVFFLYFSEATNRLSGIFIKNSHMIKNYGLSKITYPLAEIGSELVTFLIGLVPFMIIMYFMGMNIHFHLLYLLPIIILFTIFTFTVGIILGSLNVFFRDIGILWITLSPALFYMSPIVYNYEIIPEKFKLFIAMNPLYHFLIIIRDVIYLHQAPQLRYVGICLIITSVTTLIAILTYRKTNNSFISNL
ncbi:MAG TPA: ABC transporter permease [Bacteroidales bacterium]|nr:ABC transporter permease [Bacteroidales bacterium]